MDREARLGQIAASILEGRPVDWSAVESSSDPDDRAVLGQLRVLEEVTALHRRLADEPAGTSAPPGLHPSHRPQWGHLRLLEPVGKGSFGEVYRAWDTHLDREVALKLLRTAPVPNDPSATLSDPSRVVHEGRLLARVRHPNVITVYGAEPRDGSVGIWMEFIRGITLHRLVEQQGRLGAREAGTIGADLCRALAAVHRAGLLHRDISARNVMREEGGRVVLMDFGAGHDDQAAREGGRGVTGTPLYIAPELFAGRPADHRSDIYALGTLLFFLVTGRYPVSGSSLEEVREAHARGARTRLRDLRPDLPQVFVRAIEQAIEPETPERFQTAGEMEAALDSAGRTGPKPLVRVRWWAAAGIAAVILVAAAGISLMQRGGAAPPDAPAGPTALTSRRVDPPPEVWPFSNPSDDGRFVAGMVTETGDGAIVDLAMGSFRPLGIGTDHSQGYASMGVMSHDGSMAAIDYHDDRGGNLYIARTDGGRPRLLLEAPIDVSPQEWSRDGSMILGLVERPGRPTVIGLVAVSDGAVRALAEVGDVRPTHMTLSADNRYVAFDSPERPGALDRDIFILDAHTGQSWPLEVTPGGDVGPFWTPDGRGLVFLSDRNRNPSLWHAPVEQGRLLAPSQLLKDGVGRVHLRGFTAAGSLHYDLSAGFAEVFLAIVDGAQPPSAEPLSPRRAVSNFYPHWSPDGRFVAYAAERSDLNATRAVRELWVYDTITRTEAAVPFAEPIGRPLGWSPDSREILTGGTLSRGLHVVDRLTGRARAIASEFEGRIAWGPAGILFGQKGKVVLVHPADGRVLREFGQPMRELSLAPDGRSLIVKRPNGRLALLDPASGAAREWTDPVEWVGLHFMAPHTAGVAYMAGRKGVNGESRTLMYWGGGGDPRELIRVPGNERFILVGWLPDGLTLLVARWENRPNRLPGEADPSTLWRVPVTGGKPMSTGLTMDGLRDVSIHPDGGRIAFNAGWKRGEQWVMENLLPARQQPDLAR